MSLIYIKNKNIYKHSVNDCSSFCVRKSVFASFENVIIYICLW